MFGCILVPLSLLREFGNVMVFREEDGVSAFVVTEKQRECVWACKRLADFTHELVHEYMSMSSNWWQVHSSLTG